MRILFAFEPVRRAVLVAGDKSGNWRGWYDAAVPLADERDDARLAELETRNYEMSTVSWDEAKWRAEETRRAAGQRRLDDEIGAHRLAEVLCQCEEGRVT